MAKLISKELQDSFKKKLFEQEKNLKKRIENLKEEDPFSDPDHAIDNAAVDTDVREKVGHETIEAQILTLKRKLDNVILALQKMSKKKYGKCSSCNNPIVIERLKLMPEARYCLTCEKRLVK
ncbi:hypothetical protein A3C23_01125 [Candidatus Roizmanbacteria bacterium RIFCSPHIGHO2_02_FULL_37_13b]|uniref:Zinc finger DksA/TraR C4-type domain-containing protein n=1 Tax=Candidatus Roizmanbacteria bacterium RIFCSPLOWO2_02_FULL_36_11 TaxID=1802071 RepID=A0A1F7JIS3_9BACT|nr:MAG: hypothetical protein A3C23_01125 [Candidatus Roizmanbacteria bacterium RIFCSPHIGHO2_02_FULL_37_13b]OGK55507.1 MAG: hypothetical protein A3H78_05060 [Candidatus Roizmanbacteria bacterium RIFCSPLOWO2_02_FULL_36_11]